MKEEFKKLPSDEMAGLLQYLVRPVKDLEGKIESVKKQFDERIHYNLDRVDKLVESVKGHELRLEDLVREPRKHENRISALEGQAKCIEPLQQALNLCKEDIEKLQKAFEILYGLNADVKELKGNYQNLRKEVVDTNVEHEKKLDALHYSCDDNRRKFEAFCGDLKGNLKGEREEAIQVYNMQNEKFAVVDKEFNKLLGKVNDFNNKVEAVSSSASERLHNAFQELAKKQDDQRKLADAQYEKLVKEMEKLSFLAEKDKHREDSDAKRLEILEMQLEKMSLSVKELKVKVDL